MTPTSVRMVLVEGEKADGLTVDHDAFTVGSDNDSATASAQVVTAILGTRESAAEGGHKLAATGVTWRDHAEAAALSAALAAHNLDDVMLVSELHAAGALAQAVGRAVGYERTALMFLERDTATISVVQTADGSIVQVQTQDLHTEDAVAQLTAMVAGLEALDEPPQGVFVVGSGVSVAAIKLQLESATSLPVSAPDEAELALARGAALASANAPRFEATTVGLAPAADATQLAGAGYMQPAASLAYSEVDDADVPELSGPVDGPVDIDADESAGNSTRRPFLLVGSAMTSIFVVGVAALVISLAVSIRPTVDERPTPGESMVVPPRPPAAASTPQPAAPEPPAPIETIQAPKPVVQEAPAPQTPRTVFVDRAPAPAAPAPAPPPAAPAPPPAAPAPAPPPAVVPAPVAPVVPPPVIVLPESIVPPILRPRWDPPRDYNPPKYEPPKYDPPSRWDPPKWEPPKWEPPKWEPPKYTPPTYEPPKQQRPKWPGSDSGSRGGSDRGSNRGSDSLWPWPSFGD